MSMPGWLPAEILIVFAAAAVASVLLKAVVTFPYFYMKRARCRRALAKWLLDHRMEAFYADEGGYSTGTLRLMGEAGKTREASVRQSPRRLAGAARDRGAMGSGSGARTGSTRDASAALDLARHAGGGGRRLGVLGLLSGVAPTCRPSGCPWRRRGL